VTYTGGFGGLCLMLIIPSIMYWNVRKNNFETIYSTKNFNKALYNKKWVVIFMFVFSGVSLGMIIWGLVKTKAPPHLMIN